MPDTWPDELSLPLRWTEPERRVLWHDFKSEVVVMCDDATLISVSGAPLVRVAAGLACCYCRIGWSKVAALKEDLV